MIRSPIGVGWRAGLSGLAVVLMVAGYFALSHRQHVKNPSDTTIPDWSQLKEGIHKAVTDQGGGEVWMWDDGKATFYRLGLGMLIGIAGAVLIGFAMGTWAPAEAFFNPLVTITAKLNPIAMLAVFFVMAGTGTQMYVAMIAFGILPALAMTVYLSAKYDVPDELIYKCYTLGASHFEAIINVVGHQVLPRILDGIRLQIGPALVYLIAAEMVVGHEGFGYRIRLQSRLVNMNVVYFYIATLALFGFALDVGLRVLLDKLCPWYVKGREEEARKQGVLSTLWALVRGREAAA